MAIVAKAGGSTVPVGEGVHIGVCSRVIDMGDQYSEKFGKTSRKVMLCWEVMDESIEIEGEMLPKVISKDYTLSLNDRATLREHLEGWRGKKFTDKELEGFDLIGVLGKACQILVTHNDNGSAKVSTIMALPKGTPAQKGALEPLYFDLDNPDCIDSLEKLPEWIQERIKQSPQYKALASGNKGVIPLADEEDLPF